MPTISPIPFTLCNHTCPPTPLPRGPFKMPKGLFPGRCQPCDISYSRSLEKMVLELYNGKIRDQKARLLIAKERKGTDQEGGYDGEMVEEGERRIREWQLERNDETLKVWEKLVLRWSGGVKVERDAEAKEGQEGRLRVWVGTVEQD